MKLLYKSTLLCLERTGSVEQRKLRGEDAAEPKQQQPSSTRYQVRVGTLQLGRLY